MGESARKMWAGMLVTKSTLLLTTIEEIEILKTLIKKDLEEEESEKNG